MCLKGSISIIAFDFSSKWKGSHGMLEVLTTIIIWLYDRILVSGISTSSSRSNSLTISKDLHLLFHYIHKKNIEVNKKTHFLWQSIFAAGNVLAKGSDRLAIATKDYI
jgi:hypothetical protein